MTYANALWQLDQANLLSDEKCKVPVKSFIRLASEDSNYHASAHYRSKDAGDKCKGEIFMSASQYQKYCSPKFSHEHIVPVEVIYNLLLKTKCREKGDFEAILRKFSIRATITRKENRMLSRSTMPEGFLKPGHDLYHDPFARYIKAGINKNLERLTQASWVIQNNIE